MGLIHKFPARDSTEEFNRVSHSLTAAYIILDLDAEAAEVGI